MNEVKSFVYQNKPIRDCSRMEMIHAIKLIEIKSDFSSKEIVTVGFYTGRSRNASEVHCVVTVIDNTRKFMQAHGKAGGYGYHKKSAALSDALRNLGFMFEDHFSGVGDCAMRDTIMAIGRFYNLSNFILVEF